MASVEVHVRAGDEVLLRVRLAKPAFAPPIFVGLRVDTQPQLPRPAVLVMRWWLPGLGLLRPLVAPLLSWLQMGPPWIAIEGDRVLVDIARALNEQGAADVLDSISALRVTTKSGAVIVSVAARVHERDPPRDA